MSRLISYSVTQGDHAITEPSMIQKLKVDPHSAGHRRFATTHVHGVREQHTLVDQPVTESLRREGRTADAQI